MEIHISVIGMLLIGLALVHAVFPTYFDWAKELRSLSLINRQLMYVHTFFIALVVLLMGILCLTSQKELAESTLGKKIALGFSLFWICRLLAQFFWYSPKLWQGKTFETIVHGLFILLWTYFSTVFMLIFLA